MIRRALSLALVATPPPQALAIDATTTAAASTDHGLELITASLLL